MKTVAIRCVSSKETTLSKATKILSKFVYTDNGAPKHIDCYLHKACKAFNKLNNIHSKSCQIHTTDDGRVVQSSVCSVDVKSENEVRRESLHNENVDEKLIRNDAKFDREFNGSVSGGIEKHNTKDNHEAGS
jgi:hypothetical protein